jgi:acetoacetyl-CoA synthetase
MPKIPEAVVAMLASISIGAVWSNAASEFGVKTILERFTQISPKWLFVSDGYQFGGKPFDRRNEIIEIVGALQECLQQVVFLPYLDAESAAPVDALSWQELLSGEDPGRDEFQFERVSHDHPLWVLFSSGTTGLPKAIVHSHIGALMGMSSCTLFHMDFKPSDVGFFYTTTGWVMFTLLVGMMLPGSSIVLYDGSPAYPEKDILWKLAADTKATYFGASPTFVQLMEQFNISPGSKYDFSSLRGISCSG